MKGAVFALAIILAACGTAPAATARTSSSPSESLATSPATSPTQSSPSPAPSASPPSSVVVGPAAGLLFAVLETPSGQAQPDTVAIVGLDGYARAKAKFQARQRPYITNAGVPLQPVAQVTGAGVYYIDGSGTVRVLRANNQPQVVASFPQTPIQYETWFAVSPDGSQVLAGVLRYPAIGAVPTDCVAMSCAFPPLVGPWKFDLQSAHAGGTSAVLYQFESTTAPDAPGSTWKPTFPVGWTSTGPVAMLPVYLATQNFWDGGPLYVIDGAGNKGVQLGGSDCHSASITPGGLIPCVTSQGPIEVRDSAGKVVWATNVFASADSIFLSPDQASISDGPSGVVVTRSGASIRLPLGFRVQGWLDKNTVAGRIISSSGLDWGNLSWISLSDPGTVHDLGFKGDFVAPLSGA